MNIILLLSQLCVKQEDTPGFTKLTWHVSTSTHSNNSELNRLAQGGITERFVTVSAAVVVVAVVGNGLIRLSSRSGAQVQISYRVSLALWPSLPHHHFEREPLFVDINGINVMGYH